MHICVFVFVAGAIEAEDNSHILKLICPETEQRALLGGELLEAPPKPYAGGGHSERQRSSGISPSTSCLPPLLAKGHFRPRPELVEGGGGEKCDAWGDQARHTWHATG